MERQQKPPYIAHTLGLWWYSYGRDNYSVLVIAAALHLIPEPLEHSAGYYNDQTARPLFEPPDGAVSILLLLNPPSAWKASVFFTEICSQSSPTPFFIAPQTEPFSYQHISIKNINLMLLHLYCFYTLSLVWFSLWGCAHLRFNSGSKWVSGREISRAQGNHNNIVSDDGRWPGPHLTFCSVEDPLDCIVCFCPLLLYFR